MVTFEKSEAMGMRYCRMMSELKYRLANIEARQPITAEGIDANNARHLQAEEVCLQLRKVLELMVLASFWANEDVVTKLPNFEGMQKAKKILLKLEKLNPRFFPLAVTAPQAGSARWQLDFVGNEAMFQQEDFAPLFDACSMSLHVHNPFASNPALDLGRPVFEWIQRIRALLETHVILLPPNQQLIVRMLPWDEPYVGYAHMEHRDLDGTPNIPAQPWPEPGWWKKAPDGPTT